MQLADAHVHRTGSKDGAQQYSQDEHAIQKATQQSSMGSVKPLKSKEATAEGGDGDKHKSDKSQTVDEQLADPTKSKEATAEGGDGDEHKSDKSQSPHVMYP